MSSLDGTTMSPIGSSETSPKSRDKSEMRTIPDVNTFWTPIGTDVENGDTVKR
jgi:hypothetical protein